MAFPGTQKVHFVIGVYEVVPEMDPRCDLLKIIFQHLGPTLIEDNLSGA
jgi:hypothetical protein